MLYDKAVCERWCVTKLCVKDGVWQSGVWKMVMNAGVRVSKMWCQRWCVKNGVWQSGVWKRVCKRWCVKDAVRASPELLQEALCAAPATQKAAAAPAAATRAVMSEVGEVKLWWVVMWEDVISEVWEVRCEKWSCDELWCEKMWEVRCEMWGVRSEAVMSCDVRRCDKWGMRSEVWEVKLWWVVMWEDVISEEWAAEEWAAEAGTVGKAAGSKRKTRTPHSDVGNCDFSRPGGYSMCQAATNVTWSC